MYTASSVRSRYAAGKVDGASNTKVVILCFDRLDRDLAEARAAIEHSDHFVANSALGHAQDLLTELAGMLDVDAWEHGGSLLALYDYLLRLLAAANVHKSVGMVAEAAILVGELGEAFRSAADTATTSSTLPTPSGDGTDSDSSARRFEFRA